MLPAAPTSSKDPLLRIEGINVLNKINASASKFGCYMYLPCSWPHSFRGYHVTYCKGTNYQEVEVTLLVQHWEQQESPQKVQMSAWPALQPRWPETPQATTEDLALCKSWFQAKKKLNIHRDGCELAGLHLQTEKAAAIHPTSVLGICLL